MLLVILGVLTLLAIVVAATEIRKQQKISPEEKVA